MGIISKYIPLCYRAKTRKTMRCWHTIVMVLEKNFRWKKKKRKTCSFVMNIYFHLFNLKKNKKWRPLGGGGKCCIVLIREIHCINHCKEQRFKTQPDTALQVDSQISLYNEGHLWLNLFCQPPAGLIWSPGRSLKPVNLVLKSKAKNRERCTRRCVFSRNLSLNSHFWLINEFGREPCFLNIRMS